MSGRSYEGVAVNVGDQVSIMGSVISTSGNAAHTQTVLVQELFGVYTFTIQGADSTAVQHPSATGRPAMSHDGKLYGVAGDSISSHGVVTAVTGSGASAKLTVKLDFSGLVVTVSAGSCHCNGA